jgi:hypothetical protein
MLLLARLRSVQCSSTRLSLSMVLLSSKSSTKLLGSNDGRTTSTYPLGKAFSLRVFPVRSPLLRESQLVYFPAATKMFQFTAFPHLSVQVAEATYEVTLGDLGLKGCMHLAQAYRSLPRPSSASRTEPFAA